MNRYQITLYVEVWAEDEDAAAQQAIRIMHEDASWEHIGDVRELGENE